MKNMLYTVMATLVGVLVGLGLYTFFYAGGINYFGHDPKACVQCHAMSEHYESWSSGSHTGVATCQDCHAPHNNPVMWLYAEADNGFWHSLKFTTGDYPENIKIRDFNRNITEDACLHCHGNLVDDIRGTRINMGKEQQISCTRCHSEVGHKR